MIQCKNDLLRYLESDRVAMGKTGKFNLFRWLTDPLWKYQRMLRRREYLVNCKPKCGLWGIVRKWNGFWFNRLGAKLGITIPPNCFDEGLYITHIGTIVVNHTARIGKNCVLNVCVNIGWRPGDSRAPHIGNNCYIGPGAKLFGEIDIGDNVKIGANSVVNKSFPDGNCTLVGVPAKLSIANK